LETIQFNVQFKINPRIFIQKIYSFKLEKKNIQNVVNLPKVWLDSFDPHLGYHTLFIFPMNNALFYSFIIQFNKATNIHSRFYSFKKHITYLFKEFFSFKKTHKLFDQKVYSLNKSKIILPKKIFIHLKNWLSPIWPWLSNTPYMISCGKT